jgi:hypothetical protein
MRMSKQPCWPLLNCGVYSSKLKLFARRARLDIGDHAEGHQCGATSQVASRPPHIAMPD